MGNVLKEKNGKWQNCGFYGNFASSKNWNKNDQNVTRIPHGTNKNYTSAHKNRALTQVHRRNNKKVISHRTWRCKANVKNKYFLFFK